MKRIPIIGLAAVLALFVVGSWYFTTVSPSAVQTQLTASGTIEADKVRISAQVGGRIEALLADEGDEVQAGQILAHLDETLLRAELKKGQAARAAAQAQLAQAQAGARPADLRKAEAAVKLARAARDGAKIAWEDAKATRDNPQELDLKIATARTQLVIAEARLVQAAAGTGAPQAQYDMLAQLYDLIKEPFTACVTMPTLGKICRDISFRTYL